MTYDALLVRVDQLEHTVHELRGEVANLKRALRDRPAQRRYKNGNDVPQPPVAVSTAHPTTRVLDPHGEDLGTPR